MQPPRLYVVTTDSQPERQARMRHRAETIGLDLHMIISPGLCMEGHLAAIAAYLADPDEPPYALVCEDDVHLHLHTPLVLRAIAGFLPPHTDMLMLGYLCRSRPVADSPERVVEVPLPDGPARFEFCGYPFEQWGTQMYAISRQYAQSILRDYGPGYAGEVPWSSDHIITKATPNRLLMCPMLAVEEYLVPYEHEGQDSFHGDSHRKHFDPQAYL